MDKQIAAVGEWVDIAKAFLVTYSFQIVGAIVFLLIGLGVSEAPSPAQFQTQSPVTLAVRTALQSAGVKLA